MISIVQQPFESSVFGGPVLKLGVEGGVTADNLDATTDAIHAMAGWKLAFARLPADGSRHGQIFLSAGFRHVETLVTLVRDCAGAPRPSQPVTIAQPADHSECRDLAYRNFSHDRFHADEAVDRPVADTLKAQWVANGLAGRADAALVVRQEGRVAGFILCMRRGEDAVIDLIAVDAACRGRGYGHALVLGALNHYAGIAPVMWVGTQSDNAASLTLYGKLGFVERDRAETYHLTP